MFFEKLRRRFSKFTSSILDARFFFSENIDFVEYSHVIEIISLNFEFRRESNNEFSQFKTTTTNFFNFDENI